MASASCAAFRFWGVARYEIDPERSRVWIHARSTLHPIHSEAKGLEGTIELELDGDGRVDLSVAPVASMSFPVARLKSSNPLEEREMKRRIDARRHPTIDGRLVSMAAGDGDEYRVSGEITFKGVTNEYEDEMAIEVVDESTVRLTGEARFDVRDFGMEPPRILMLRVEPEVDVRVEIVASASEEA
jgi:polyisoprenoid-binding protein YceI